MCFAFDRITKEDTLTYRGEEKAKELLRFFDSDGDDMLDFSDFRGYLAHFNR